MSKKPKQTKSPDTDIPPTGEDEMANGDQSELSADPLLMSLALMESENAELKERLLRAAADMENLRKRTERELRETRQFAIASFARDMLVASDNLSRAIMVLPEGERSKAKGTLKALIDGMEMTDREMVRLMEKNGVTRIDPQGERFDPNFHQAMFEVPDTSVPDGTVSEVVQAGFVIGSRILRPAMVAVARGGPKQDPGATPNGTDSPEATSQSKPETKTDAADGAKSKDEAAQSKSGAAKAGSGSNVDKNA
ncbi:MAG: nucleotide exchange factor GrpE [Alphaproteobacteria bacterium]|nr:nucleotide exchange factor GrpE [Alphaproteobacteria bacterium]